MDDIISGGVLIGLSGGADSVFLSLFISEYQKREKKNFSVLAIHINHMIRGEEAERDEKLSRSLAESLGFEYESFRIDVPQLSSENGEGIELVARNARYSKFAEILRSRKDISCIATAHNSGDNVETVIFNLCRGCGINGASGIAPVRDNIIRPLLPISKSEIISLLDEFNISFAIDSTNFSTEYTRNYIRHEILPKLERINPRFESSFRAFSDSALLDNDFISVAADRALDNRDSLSAEYLLSLHPALRARVVGDFCYASIGKSLERVQINAISDLLHKANFRVSIGAGFDFVCERGSCYVVKRSATDEVRDFYEALESGDNKMPGYNAVISILPREKSYPIIYNKSIKADLSSAIINGVLYVRFKRDGDAYHYGGMTHKLKKVFNDLDIPPSHRGLIPVVCDDNGIVWVPGLGVRDDCAVGEGHQYTIVINKTSDHEGEDIYFAHKEIH